MPTVRIVRHCSAPHALLGSTLVYRGCHLLIAGTMSATKILWGQIIVVFAIVLVAMWAATQWVAWKLGYQPQLGQPWFELVPGVPVYLPPAFFWWWYAYDAYAPHVFVEGAYIAASGGIHLDRSRHRHVGMAGTRGEDRRNLWLGPLGDFSGGPCRGSLGAGRRRARPARAATTFATTAPSMCCASRRPGPARASASSCRPC